MHGLSRFVLVICLLLSSLMLLRNMSAEKNSQRGTPTWLSAFFRLRRMLKFRGVRTAQRCSFRAPVHGAPPASSTRALHAAGGELALSTCPLTPKGGLWSSTNTRGFSKLPDNHGRPFCVDRAISPAAETKVRSVIAFWCEHMCCLLLDFALLSLSSRRGILSVLLRPRCV